jgi:[protein-PII] uridylyltransferase
MTQLFEGDTELDVDPEAVLEFIAGMPEAYRAGHNRESMLDHARLSITRGAAAVAVGTFRSTRHDGLPVCIVTDDRPGLLSFISAALVASGLDVVRAEAYSRETSRGVESASLFWLRAAGPEPSDSWVAPSDVVLFRTLLLVLLEGTLARGALLQHLRERGKAKSRMGVRVRFVAEDDGHLAAIDVETVDRPGLLFVLTDALTQQRVQIVRSEIRTIRGRAFDRFYVRELDGTGVSRRRETAISSAVLAALSPTFRPQSGPPAVWIDTSPR